MQEIQEFIILLSDIKVGDVRVWGIMEQGLELEFRLVTSVEHTIHPTLGYPCFKYTDVLVEFDSQDNLILFVDCIGRGTGVDHFVSIVPPEVMATIGDVFKIEAGELPEWFANGEFEE